MSPLALLDPTTPGPSPDTYPYLPHRALIATTHPPQGYWVPRLEMNHQPHPPPAVEPRLTSNGSSKSIPLTRGSGRG
eukprot:763930-Hanusia_phi.AAC.6